MIHINMRHSGIHFLRARCKAVGILWSDSSPLECKASPWERDRPTGLMCHTFFLCNNFYFESPIPPKFKQNHSQRTGNFSRVVSKWANVDGSCLLQGRPRILMHSYCRYDKICLILST